MLFRSALEPAQPCPSPSVLAFQRGDATLRAGAPLHEFDEPVAGFDLLTGLAGLTLAEDRDECDTRLGMKSRVEHRSRTALTADAIIASRPHGRSGRWHS